MLFDLPVLDAAYSDFCIYPGNTAAHYRLAVSCGFPALKGDLQLTSDGGLVMCHDDGLTLNPDGTVGRFDPKRYLDFSDISFDRCTNLTYGRLPNPDGSFERVCSFDTYVRICKETGRVVYITARARYIPQVVAEIFRVLRLHGMEDRALVNSFTYETLAEVRRYCDTVPVSNVQEPGVVLDKETVDRITALGSSVVTMFSCGLGDPAEKTDAVLEQSRPALEHAREHGTLTHMAIVPTAAEREKLISLGFSGFHLGCPMAPYLRPEEA